MRAAAVGLALGAAVTGGCVLFTGSTDGYSAIEAGGSSCTSTASCEDGGLCCLMATSSAKVPSGTCLASCSVTFPQLCTTNAECGDAGPCSMQTCTIDGGGGLSFMLQACGQVPDCTASP